MEKWIRPRFQPGIPLGADGRRVTAGKEHIAGPLCTEPV